MRNQSGWIYLRRATSTNLQQDGYGVHEPEIRCQDLALIEDLVIAAIAYGDETYNPGMPWNVGNCTLGIGVSSCEQHSSAIIQSNIARKGHSSNELGIVWTF